MTDLLQQIDAGIARHQPKKVSGFCAACSLVDTLFRWPCETLKALQGWREAEVRARAAEAIALGGKLCISQQHADLEARLREAVVEGERLKDYLARITAARLELVYENRAAEAKLKDAEAQVVWAKARIATFEESSEADARCINRWADRHKDAEEKMRGLGEERDVLLVKLNQAEVWCVEKAEALAEIKKRLLYTRSIGKDGMVKLITELLDLLTDEALTQAKREGE